MPEPRLNLRTLVIGGSGYIGMYLVPILIESGRSVSVLGRKKLLTQELPNEANYISGDFGDIELIKELLKTHDEVIHMAYASVPNTSYENPLGDLLENLPPAVQLFSVAAEAGIKLLFVSSGGTVYGEPESLPISESHPTKPISPYGLTKLTLENYARLYSITKSLKFLCVRPANAFGIGQVPFKGQGFISTAIASIIRGGAVDLYGENGTIRDYVYVSDLAYGIFKVLDSGVLGETYNIGSGIGMSNLDVILRFKPILEDMGFKIQINNLPPRSFDVAKNVLDSKKIKEHTGWKESISFDEGLLLTVRWLMESYA